MSRLPYVMLACLLGGQVLTAQQSAAKHDVAAELKDLDRQWQDAIVLGDTAFIRERTSEDFVFTHGGGATQTKADWIRIAQRMPRRFLERRTSNQSTEIHGDVAMTPRRSGGWFRLREKLLCGEICAPVRIPRWQVEVRIPPNYSESRGPASMCVTLSQQS